MHQVIVSDLREKTNPASKRRLSEQERSFQDADVQRTRYVNAPLQELLCRIQDGQVVPMRGALQQDDHQDASSTQDC